jgi:hypothetical protein
MTRRLWKAALAAVLSSLLFWLVLPYVRGTRVGLNSSQPFLIELGRGSGWHGLDTVRVLDDGTTTLCRQAGGDWETAEIHLPPEGVARVRDSIKNHELLQLNASYHDPNIADGTQWVLRLQQGGTEKAVYFNNRFPAEITRFATELDEVLEEYGAGATWRRVAYLNQRNHERALWESIHAKP